jgi:hypothetical protein
MAEISDFERRANQYLTEHVAKGGKRDDVLADWARSENPELQKYAKSIFVKDLNPDQAAAEVTGNNPPGNEDPGMASYLQMAGDMAPVVAPVAAGSAALAYYYGKKKGQGVEPTLSDFESKKQQLELERMQLQNDVERARLNQMVAKGQPLDTQAKFSEPTAIEVAADTTSVREPSPATVAVDKVQQAQQLAEANRQLGLGNQPVAPGPIARNALPMGAVNPAMFSSSPKAPRPDFDQPVSTPISAAPIDAPAPTPSAKPNSFATETVVNEVKDMIQQETPQGMYRDPAGNLVYPKEMSPGARAGAEAFAQQYPEQAAALEAEKRFAILGAGAADNNLYNAYGAELRKQILNEVNQGQPAGVSPNYTERINPAIKAISPESALGKQLQDLRVNEPKSAVRGRLGTPAAVTPTGLVQGSKIAEALKNAGKISLVMAMTDAANAATKGDYTGAAKIAGPALDPTGILEAAVNPQSTARNITNVSPVFGFLSQLFASQADERAKKAYVDKVGGGRGLTPASAYPR